jgi:heptosyltransferase III
VPLQTDTLDRLAPGSRVAVIRLRSLGDCVLTTPALHLLKQARPDLQIGVAVEDRFAAVFENNPDVTRILAPRAREIRDFTPVLCLNLHGGTRSARLTLLSGSRFRAGFDIFRPGWIYNTPIPTAQEVLGVERRVHTAEHIASAMFYLGVPITSVPRAQLSPSAERSGCAPEGRFAVIHPFAATHEKAWPSDSFLELARYLERNLGFQVVFIGGPEDDPAKFRQWRAVTGAPLGETIRLIRDAAFFAGNDSGPAHIAAAFGIPQLIFFGPSDSEVWAPWQTPSEILKADGPIRSISIDQAVGALERLRVQVL